MSKDSTTSKATKAAAVKETARQTGVDARLVRYVLDNRDKLPQVNIDAVRAWMTQCGHATSRVEQLCAALA